MKNDFPVWETQFVSLLLGRRILKRLLTYIEVNAFFNVMKKRRKMKDKLIQMMYHNGKLQKNAIELKKSIDTVSDFLDKSIKKKK